MTSTKRQVISHKDHAHPSTSAARAECRRQMAEAAAKKAPAKKAAAAKKAAPAKTTAAAKPTPSKETATEAA